MDPLKKTHKGLLILCAEEDYNCCDNLNCNNQELVPVTHMPSYLDALRWSRQIFVKIDTVYPNRAVNTSGSYSVIIKVINKRTCIFNESFWKQSTLEHGLQKQINAKRMRHNNCQQKFNTDLYLQTRWWDNVIWGSTQIYIQHWLKQKKPNDYVDWWRLVCYQNDDGRLS